MKMKKIISLFLSIVMLMSLMAGLDFSAYADVVTGTCGDNVTWSYDSDTTTLTISGTGDMTDYAKTSAIPWYSSYRNTITTIIVESGVTSIGDYAFYSCAKATSVTISNTVTSIGEKAFYTDKLLTSVTLPNSITSLGAQVFYGCTALVSINIPNQLTTIPAGAFANCTSLTSIEIPSSVTTIADGTSSSTGAFGGCTSLTEIVIPDTVTSLGAYAFYGCSSLQEITLSKNITEIPNYAFRECKGFTSFEIPETITTIGVGAFYGCTGLTSITVPRTVTSLGQQVFTNCTGLVTATVLADITELPTQCFKSCSSLKTLYYNCTITNANTSTTTIVPTSVTTRIEVHLYDEVVTDPTCTEEGYTSMVCPNCDDSYIVEGSNTEALGHDYQFTGTVNEDLESVYCTEDYYFLYECSNCGDYYLSELQTANEDHELVTTTTVVKEATCTEDGSHYENVTCSICGYVETSGDVAITDPALGHSYADEITDPTCTEEGYTTYTCSVCGDTYKDDYTDALGHTDADPVKEKEIEENCTDSGSYESVVYCAVCNEELSREAVIVDALGHDCADAVIENYVGATCLTDGSYNSVVYCNRCERAVETTYIVLDALGHDVDIIATRTGGDGSSYDVTGCNRCLDEFYADGTSQNITWHYDIVEAILTVSGSGEIPSYTKGAPWKAYKSDVETLIIESGLTSTGSSAFSSFSALTSVTLPNTITEISNNSFAGCTSLESIDIPSSVTSIGSYAFYYCEALSYVVIPAAVESIGVQAFYKCNLTGIEILNPTCNIDTSAKTISSSSVVIYAHEGSTANDYADLWSKTFVSTSDHNYKKKTTAATCTEDGYTTYTCTICGDSYKSDYKSATGHTTTKTTTKATTSENGKIVTTCSTCGKKTTKVIAYPKKVTLSTTRYTYNGKAKKPTVTVYDSHGNVIDSKYYTVSYSNNVNVGKATVTITFKGSKYSGTIKTKYKISPKKTSITSVTAKKSAFTVKWDKVTTQVSGYEIQYSTSKDFSSSTTKSVWVKSAKTGSQKVSGLTSGTKYYVRVRTYKTVNGTKYFSKKWSNVKSVTVK